MIKCNETNLFLLFHLLISTSPRPLSLDRSASKLARCQSWRLKNMCTDLIVSMFETNETNANTCLSMGIGSLPKRFPQGIEHVAVTSLLSASNVILVIRKWDSNLIIDCQDSWILAFVSLLKKAKKNLANIQQS